MSILRRMILAAIDPNYNSERAELARLRGQAAAVPRKKQWYRMVNGGATTGFSHVCACAQELKIVAPLDLFRNYHCLCGESFSLLKDAGVPKGCAHNDIGEYLMRLPARNIGAAPQRQPVPKVGTWDNSGECVEWCGSPQG